MIQPTTRFQHLQAQSVPDISIDTDEASEGAIADLSEVNDQNSPVIYEKEFCNGTIAAACVRGLYGLQGISTEFNEKAYGLGIAGFLEQNARYSDWRLFAESQAPWLNNKTHLGLVTMNGAFNNESDTEHDSTEAQLDIEFATALTPNISTTYYLTAGRGPLLPASDQPSQDHNTNEPFLDHLLSLAKIPTEQLPRVMSYSYGENEQSVPREYAESVCTMFALLSMRGVSVIFSSGDSGPGKTCKSNITGKMRFNPIFPATCPYVTAVGGTTNVEPEIAWSSSSGGFSDYFAAQAFQQPHTDRFKNVLLQKDAFNSSGRGFPDVAAQASNYRIVDQGRGKLVQGTSASAPVFAAVIANLNRVRWEQGKPPLGYLNPWLYSLKPGQGLTDIIDGGSIGCRNEPVLLPAIEGWDWVTGLGTPNYELLLQNMP